MSKHQQQRPPSGPAPTAAPEAVGYVEERVEWTEGPGITRWRCVVTLVSRGNRTEHRTEWHLLEDFTARWATVRANAKLALVDRMGPGA